MSLRRVAEEACATPRTGRAPADSRACSSPSGRAWFVQGPIREWAGRGRDQSFCALSQVRIGSCALTRSIVDRPPGPAIQSIRLKTRRLSGPFQFARRASTGCGLGSGNLGGQPVVVTAGATRVVARASVFGARGCGCGSTGPKGAGTDHGNVLRFLQGTDERYEHRNRQGGREQVDVA
jgi:hypothetical protein